MILEVLVIVQAQLGEERSSTEAAHALQTQMEQSSMGSIIHCIVKKFPLLLESAMYFLGQLKLL